MYKNRMYKYSMYLVVLALITGCGGSGSESSSSAAGNSNSGNESIADTDNIATSELKTSSSFDFSNNQNISLDVQLAEFSDERVMINVCLPKESENSGVIAIDYGQCLYKSTITHGQLQTPITLASHNELLILEVRSFSDLASSSTYQWQPSDGSYWVVR